MPAAFELETPIDLRGLAARAAVDGLRRMGARLDEHRMQDLISYLTIAAIRADRRYDPARSHGLGRSTFIYRSTRPRVTDWMRTTLGDARAGDPLLSPKSAIPLAPMALRHHLPDTEVLEYEPVADALDRLGEGLSHEGKAALREVAVPLACGWRASEIARALGIRRGDVEERLERLRAELMKQGEVSTSGSSSGSPGSHASDRSEQNGASR